MDKLFTGFKDIGPEEWKARMEKDLKGITFDQLTYKDRNGIDIAPFYARERPSDRPAIKNVPDWDICAQVRVAGDAVAANKKALQALSQGASGLHFYIREQVSPALLLQDIELPYIYTYFELAPEALGFAAELNVYLEAQGRPTADLSCYVGCDYLQHAWAGQATGDPAGKEAYKERFLESFRNGSLPPMLAVDARPFQNAGATPVYELACTLGLVQEYLHQLEGAGLLSQLRKCQVSLCADTQFFEQIAKTRALRHLLSLLFDAYGLRIEVRLHAETSQVFLSPVDRYTNLLRNALAGMAAVLGGADSLYVHPFDGADGQGSEMGERLARNQQLIFKDEAYLDKVADIPAGSYYQEYLADQLASKAWALFQELESKGGILEAYRSGDLQRAIGEQAQDLLEEYRQGKRALIGVNKYPNPDEGPYEAPPIPAKGPGLAPLHLARLLLAQESPAPSSPSKSSHA